MTLLPLTWPTTYHRACQLRALGRSAGPQPPPTPPPMPPPHPAQAEKLVAKMDRMSAVSGELGLALFRISKEEEAQGGHLAQHTGTVRGRAAAGR